jgi:hypothetical protein
MKSFLTTPRCGVGKSVIEGGGGIASKYFLQGTDIL